MILEPATVPAYLVERGLVPAGAKFAVTALDGGVSCSVFSVESTEGSWVVKQALEQLRVVQVWLADPRRAGTEAEALRICHSLTPSATPALIDADEDNHTLTMTQAPSDWQNWKLQLLAGDVRPEVGAILGSVLARWHNGTTDSARLHRRFLDLTSFEELRVAPFHRAVQTRHPAVHDEIDAVIARMLTARRCLVHGDFSPKNMLVGGGQVWVLDFEVAHYGDPTFDLAFLLAHLCLKSAHLPGLAAQLWTCAAAFLDAYRENVRAELLLPAEHLLGQVACLLLARVDGKSPAGYLTPDQQEIIRALSLAMLIGTVSTLEAAFVTAGCRA